MSNFVEYKVTQVDENGVNVDSFLGSHTPYKGQTVVHLRSPKLSELTNFANKISTKIDSLDSAKKREYLDNGLYRVDFEDFFLQISHDFIYLKDEKTHLYSSYEDMEEETNVVNLSDSVAIIKNFFFTFTPLLRSWNLNKMEEEAQRTKIMAEYLRNQKGELEEQA